MLDQLTNFNKLKSTEIIQNMFFDPNEIRSNNKKISGISLNVWNVNNTLLNNLQVIIIEANE